MFNRRLWRRNNRTNTLRFRLTATFIAFALIIIALLWTLQVSMASEYYEYSMEKKSKAIAAYISTNYTAPGKLEMKTFANQLSVLAGKSDISFYIQAADESFTISTKDNQTYGRVSADSRMIEKAMAMLDLSDGQSVSYMEDLADGSQVLVSAKYIDTKYRTPIYLVTAAALTPLGPAMDIMRSLLLIITFIALALACIIAFLYSKRMAKPAAILTEKAKELSRGNYDVDFSVKGYREIEDLAFTLTQAAADLKKSNQLQKDLMANVSHDLRTPLTMIKSYAELIRDISGDCKEKRDEDLQIIIDESDRLADLVGDILVLSKLQAGTEKITMGWFDLRLSLEGVLGVYKVLEESEGFKFNLKIPAGPIYVYGDEQRIKRVISNFISNAVKYSREEDKNIDISIDIADSKARLSVADHGVGIPSEELAGIWNRYQKASNKGTRALGGSTGLGLSIAREILEKHNSAYGVDSTEGKGSCFWFTLFCRCMIGSNAASLEK